MVVELWQSWEVDLRFVQYRSQTHLQVTDTRTHTQWVGGWVCSLRSLSSRLTVGKPAVKLLLLLLLLWRISVRTY